MSGDGKVGCTRTDLIWYLNIRAEPVEDKTIFEYLRLGGDG
jgi:hypothetical protein